MSGGEMPYEHILVESEAGVGIFGELAPGLRYQLSIVDGLNANGFSAPAPLEGADQNASIASASDLGAVARIHDYPADWWRSWHRSSPQC